MTVHKDDAARTGESTQSPAHNGAESPTRQRIGAARRREQILDVAARHFEQGPYTSVSTAAIADEAGVGRPLIHYYFKTKRDLYLEVVRRIAFVPPHVPTTVVQGIPADALEDRIRASIDYWLTVAARHQLMWTSTISLDAHDQDLQDIVAQADDVAAGRMLEALALTDHPRRPRLHALLLAYGGMVRSAGRQWLIHRTLTRDEVVQLLTGSLLTLIRDIEPTLPNPNPSAQQYP